MTNMNDSVTPENKSETPISRKKNVHRGARGKMPRVQSMDSPGSPGLGSPDNLPGVPGGSSPGTDGDLSEGGIHMATRPRPASELSMVERIELLNVYKAIHGDIPRKAGENKEWVQSIVQAEYQAWVDSKMAELFGDTKPKAPTSAFSEEETVALKALAQAVAKRKAPAAPANAAPKAPPADKPFTTERYIKGQEDFLQQLAKLDREGPNF